MRNHKFCLLFCLLLLHYTGVAQVNPLTINEQNLVEILTTLEKETNWTFNYDPLALKAYKFKGTLNQKTIAHQLTHLFYETPYTFEISNQIILIYEAPLLTYRICGTIKDATSKTTLALANVFADDFKQGMQSNDAGFFDFSIKAKKHQTINLSYIGYESQSFKIQEWDTTTCAQILLKIDSRLFGEEIIVKDYLLPEISEGKGYGAVHIDYKQLGKRQTIIDQDILKTVQLIPGVSSTDESAINLQIRGGTPDQNLILWEDVTLYNPGHLFGMISAINPFVVDQVQIYKGAFDPRYDNRIGGIVDLSLSDSLTNRLHGGLGTTFSEAHAFLQFPIIKGRLSVLVSGRNSINGLFPSPTLSNYSSKVFQVSKVADQQNLEELELGSTDQDLAFYDLNAKLIFQPFQKMHVTASWLKTNTDYKYTAFLNFNDVENNDDVYFDSQAFSLSSTFQITDNWQSKLAFRSSSYKNDYLLTFEEQAILTYRNQLTNGIKDKTISFASEHQVTSKIQWQVGYDYNSKQVDFQFNFEAKNEASRLDVNLVDGHFHNAYTSINFQDRQLQVNGGLRTTYYSEAEHLAFSPRVNIQYAINKAFKLKLSGGIFYQYTSQLNEFGENDLGLDNQIWIINRSEYEDDFLQSANKLAAGFSYHKNGWLVDMEGYTHQTEGLSALAPLFGTTEAIGEDFSIGSSTAKGVDVLVKKQWTAYRAWLNYSLSKVDFYFPKISDHAFAATNDQRHQLSIINSYTYKQWNISLSYQYKSGLPFTLPNEVKSGVDQGRLDATGDLAQSSYYYIDYAAPNAARLKAYSRLDVGLTYRPVFKKWNLRGEFSVSLVNILQQNNVLSRNYYLQLKNPGVPNWLGIDRQLLRRTPLVSLRIYW